MPIHDVFTVHLPKRLKSRRPIWDLKPTKDAMVEIWKKRWKNFGVRNISLIDNPGLRVPSFEFPRVLWTTLKRVRTEQGKCNYLMYK